MQEDVIDSAAEAQASDAAEAKRAPAWKAALNDKIIKGLKLELPPVGYDRGGKLLFSDKPVARPQSYS